MKILRFVALLALALPALAQSPAITQSAAYPWRLQVDFVTPAGGGTITAAPVTQFYRSDVMQGSVVIAQPASAIPALTVDLVAKAASTVTVNGTTYTYAQALQIMTAIFAQERAAQLSAAGAPPNS